MLKQLFKKLQKILISIEIKHFLFLLYYSTNLHDNYFFKNIFRKLTKFFFMVKFVVLILQVQTLKVKMFYISYFAP